MYAKSYVSRFLRTDIRGDFNVDNRDRPHEYVFFISHNQLFKIVSE